VSNAHLLPILAASLDEPPYYLAMPFLEGPSLAAYLDADQALDLPFIFWIARQVAEAAAALHRAGWIHGDVKPSNLIVSASGHATLIDLGFASPIENRVSIADRPVAGTLNYMAPEVLYSATGGDAASDVYSLGVMLFEMLTGRLPFDADDVAELALQHRQQLPSDVRSLVPAVPVRGARLVRQMLSKDPLRRPTSEELVDRLVMLEIETFTERLGSDSAASE
jgi:eukaryotic-like serine/threonine-protein kinase